MEKSKRHSIEWRAKVSASLKGRIISPEWRKKISDAQKGKKANNWKGNKATYNSIHHWVRRNFGRPSICEHCTKEFVGLRIHWANVSGQYKRDRKDWVRLCAKCHRKYDRENPIICKRLFSHKK